MIYFGQLQPQDKVIVNLDDKEQQRLNAIKEQYDLAVNLKTKTLRAMDKFQAMQTLFWDRMMDANERCETAVMRNKTLLVCHNDDNQLVVVERPSPPPSIFNEFD